MPVSAFLQRFGNWAASFAAAAIIGLAFAPDAPAAEFSDRQSVEQLVAEADASDSSPALVQSTGERGIATALICAEFLDERKPRRSQALYETIALAGNCRRSHPEVLRLYHPEAYRLFHSPDGVAGQRRIAIGLAWEEWPASLPDAIVRAAPVPLLEWLRAQAAGDAPSVEKIRLFCQPIGWWLRARNERRYVRQFHEAVAALTRNAAIISDVPTRAALLQLIADAGAHESLDFVVGQLDAPQAEIRAAAAVALGRLIPVKSDAGRPPDGDDSGQSSAALDRSLTAFLHTIVTEKEPAVLLKLAASAEAWPAEPRVGQAMLDLFSRASDAGSHQASLGRAVLFSVMRTHWPQRGAIILRAFDAPAAGVLGTALQAAAIHPLPELAPRVLELLGSYKEPEPHLIDAAGALADPHATPQLLRWLKVEKNVAVRLKLALALEKIPGEASDRALTDMLAHEADPMLAGQLCRIASRRTLPDATPVLASLAEDSTAPMPIRGQAVWALGRHAEPRARKCLAGLLREPDKYLPAQPVPDAEADSIEQMRLLIILAAMRQGVPALEFEVARHFERGTPFTQLTCLLALAETKTDHFVIAAGLASGDFAVLLGAVKAAGAAAPAKYHAQLQAMRRSPFISALCESGLDTRGLPDALDDAIRAGDSAPAQTPR